MTNTRLQPRRRTVGSRVMRTGAYQTHVRSGKDPPAAGSRSVWAGRLRSLTAGYQRHESRKEEQKRQHDRRAGEPAGVPPTEHHAEKHEHERPCETPPRATG